MVGVDPDGQHPGLPDVRADVATLDLSAARALDHVEDVIFASLRRQPRERIRLLCDAFARAAGAAESVPARVHARLLAGDRPRYDAALQQIKRTVIQNVALALVDPGIFSQLLGEEPPA